MDDESFSSKLIGGMQFLRGAFGDDALLYAIVGLPEEKGIRIRSMTNLRPEVLTGFIGWIVDDLHEKAGQPPVSKDFVEALSILTVVCTILVSENFQVQAALTPEIVASLGGERAARKAIGHMRDKLRKALEDAHELIMRHSDKLRGKEGVS
jgi:hypothetical protein